jgi:hypothetical protein
MNLRLLVADAAEISAQHVIPADNNLTRLPGFDC